MGDAKSGLYGSSFGGNNIKVGLAEFIGTFFLVLAGTAVATSAIIVKPIAGNAPDSLAVALAFGAVLIALVGSLGHISGAHFNPAVTLGLAITKKFPWSYVPTYIVAQVTGAIAASATVLYTFGHQAKSVAFLGATFPTPGTTSMQALFIEALITFLLMFVIMSVATDPRVPPAVVGPAIGLALAAAVLIGGPISGGAVNPARALGPMIVSGVYNSWWIYIVGPVVGSIGASFLYGFFLVKTEQPTAQ